MYLLSILWIGSLFYLIAGFFKASNSAIWLDLSDFPTRSRFSGRAEMEGSACVGERDHSGEGLGQRWKGEGKAKRARGLGGDELVG